LTALNAALRFARGGARCCVNLPQLSRQTAII
jgi:hypothetical protein